MNNEYRTIAAQIMAYIPGNISPEKLNTFPLGWVCLRHAKTSQNGIIM